MMQLAPDWQAMLAGKRLLIFDFDGTVADTTPLHAAAFQETLVPFGIQVDYSIIAGMKTRDALLKCGERAGIAWSDSELASLVRRKQALVRRSIKRGLQPLPGVDEFLRTVRFQYALAMVTSGSRATVELSMWALGYSGWFDPLVTADETSRSKPDPEGYMLALRIANASAREALVFEDADAGLRAAECAGIDVCDVRERPFTVAVRETAGDRIHASRC